MDKEEKTSEETKKEKPVSSVKKSQVGKKKVSEIESKNSRSASKKVVVKKTTTIAQEKKEAEIASKKNASQSSAGVKPIRKVVKKSTLEKKEIEEKKTKNEEILEERKNVQIPINQDQQKKEKGELARQIDSNKINKKLLLIIAIILAYLFILPFSVTLKTKGESKTIDGSLDLEIHLSSIKPMSEVYYAINPKDEKDIKNYEKMKTTGSIFNKKIKLDKIDIPVGKNKLYIYTKSYLFSHTIEEIPITFDLGYMSEPEKDKIIKTESGSRILANELLISVKEGTNESEVKKLIKEDGGEIVGALYFLDQYQVKFDTNSESELNQIYEKLKDGNIVENITYNYITERTISSEKEEQEAKIEDLKTGDILEKLRSWHLDVIEGDKALREIKEKNKIKVGVLDTPIDYKHDDLDVNVRNINMPSTEEFPDIDTILDFYRNNVVYTKSLNDEELEKAYGYRDFRNHATHVTGIIAALHNKKGMSGINDYVTIMGSSIWYMHKETIGNNQTILNSESTFFSEQYGLSYLIMSGCRVVNVSIGTSLDPKDKDYEKDLQAIQVEIPEQTESYRNLFEKLEKAGKDFLIVKAAGNNALDAGTDVLNRAFKDSEVGKRHTIVVGAIAPTVTKEIPNNPFTQTGARKQYAMSSYSNYGNLIDVVAPGNAIYSTVFGNKYESLDGTSMAAPMVSGIASLIYRENPNLTAEEVKNIIIKSYKDECVKDKKMYRIVNAYNAVMMAKKSQKEIKEKESPKYGFIQGKIQDASTKKVIESETIIRITKPEDDSFSVLANSEQGNYEIFLEPGTYHMEVYSNGYIIEKIYNIEVTEGITTYNILLNLIQDREDVGNAEGFAVDAFDASKIANAELKFYRGINRVDGDPTETAKTDENGKYHVSLSPGNYTVQASAEGYTSSTTNIIVISGTTTADQDCTLTPILKEGEIRAILTWGETPRDLDSHLVGPTVEGGKFHIYYSSKNFTLNGQLYNNLDVDDTSSYGPETTSVYINVGGTYTYYVHDFTNRGRSNSSALSQSGATVKLYVAGQEKPITYYVPTGEGTLWKVFSMTDGVVTPINELIDESEPGSVGSR